MFTPEDIKKRLKQQPFVPFRVVTSAGQAYDVAHPDLLWVGAREVHVGFAHPKKPTLYDSTARIALMHVTALEDLPTEATPPGKNGPVS